MFWILVGHRGVGKSQFVDRLKAADHQEPLTLLSLDSLIEDHVGRSIQEIFAKEGEEAFRRYERNVLQMTFDKFKNKPTMLDVGAGCLGPFPSTSHVLWVRRPTDTQNFRFLNRPNLDGSLGITKDRFETRQEYYQSSCDLSFELMEGAFHSSDFEKASATALIKNQPLPLDSSSWMITLLDQKHFEFHREHRLLHSLRFELRDDLLSQQQIFDFLEKRPDSLVSLRDPERGTLDNLPKDCLWDWPLEWGENSQAPVLSLHRRQKSFKNTLLNLPSTSTAIIKLAVPVYSFTELKLGYEWQKQNPEQRIFLPSSENGRWAWFRLLTGAQMPFSFLREGSGSAPDQPTLQSVFRYDLDAKNFSAILGSPVHHSLTPSYHHEYFKNKQANIFSIDIEQEDFSEALPFLKELGLRWAAVTSPLKKTVAKFIDSDLSAVNTICLQKEQVLACSTDAIGFNSLIGDVASASVAVWGGGGTIEAIRSLLPNASFYSSRDGSLKHGVGTEDPDFVIWAVGRKMFEKRGIFPPSHWKPRKVFDLNYTSDSLGIDCAYNYGCQYQSGLIMFIDQAVQQQEFWNECELK